MDREWYQDYRPDTGTAVIGGAGILILFIPVPIITQIIGIPLLLYAAYRYWGGDSRD